MGWGYNRSVKVYVTAKAGAKNNLVKQTSENSFDISVKAQAKENKANAQVTALLAKYYKLPKSAVKLTKGHKSKHKIFEIDTQRR